jgi:hypothetical protein
LRLDLRRDQIAAQLRREDAVYEIGNVGVRHVRFEAFPCTRFDLSSLPAIELPGYDNVFSQDRQFHIGKYARVVAVHQVSLRGHVCLVPHIPASGTGGLFSAVPTGPATAYSATLSFGRYHDCAVLAWHYDAVDWYYDYGVVRRHSITVGRMFGPQPDRSRRDLRK